MEKEFDLSEHIIDFGDRTPTVIRTANVEEFIKRLKEPLLKKQDKLYGKSILKPKFTLKIVRQIIEEMKQDFLIEIDKLAGDELT